MKICHSLLLIWLALLSRVSAERPQTVVATIPNESLLQNVVKNGSDELPADEEGLSSSSMKDFEVTAFITKNGDIFELPASRSMGSIEAREEPELEPGMTMCRYGTIVVYSDTGCNNFFNSSDIVGRPFKPEIQYGNEVLGEDGDAIKPLKKKKNKRRGNKRRTNMNKNKNRNNINRQKQQRKKALKSQQNQRRRRNKLKNGGKHGYNSQKKNKQRVNMNRNRNRNGNSFNKNKKRNGNNVNKRRRINKGEERSDATAPPLQFTILLNRN